MYFRCGDCAAATWIDRPQPPSRGDQLDCGECKRIYEVRPLASLGASLAQHYRSTLELSNERRIDMPSAYAILLGIQGWDQVRPLRRGPPDIPPRPSGRIAVDSSERRARSAGRKARPRPSPLARPRRRRRFNDGFRERLLDCDPAFQRAIDEGRLTVEQAIARGSREAFASSLARRHRLPMELGYHVADNHIDLREARRRVSVARRPRGRRLRGLPLVQVALVLTIACGAVGTVGAHLWSRHFESLRPAASASPIVRPSAHPRVRRPVPTAAAPTAGERLAALLALSEIHRDGSGQIVEIIGPDPTAVLETYCFAAGEPGRLEPLEITETVPRLGNARHGVFREASGLEPALAIWMREDRRTGRWVAGDGKGPIPATRAPTLPEGGFRKPLRAQAPGQFSIALVAESTPAVVPD